MTSTLLETGDPDLVGLVDQILNDFDDSTTASDHRGLWAALTQAEIHLIGLPTSHGGAGGTLTDALAVAMACARHGQATPFVENHLGQLALTTAGEDATSDLAVVVSRPEVRGDHWRLRGVGWAREAATLLILDPDSGRLWSAERAVAALAEHSDLAGDPADDVVVPTAGTAIAGESPVRRAELEARRTLLRAAQISGAIRGCYDITRRYTSEREQFGKPLNAFPDVQRHLVELAQAAAITQLAVWRAAHAHALAPTDLTVVRLPKMIADLQAKEAIRCAHQAHGAIGMTREYPLHRLTRRLHTWSLDNSDESPSQGLADAVVQRGSLTRFVWNPGWPS